MIEQLYVTAPNSPGQWKEYNLKYVWNVTRVVYLENILGENVVIEFIKSICVHSLSIEQSYVTAPDSPRSVPLVAAKLLQWYSP